jgi:glycosyltransferase involved in cell wall biosynthesis
VEEVPLRQSPVHRLGHQELVEVVTDARRVLIISQVPPPFHGSTVMTLVTQRMLGSWAIEDHLVDRRFSKSVTEVGQFSKRKVFEAFSIVFRLIRALLSGRYDTCIFFVTNRKFSFIVDVALSEVLRWSQITVVAYVHTLGYRELAQKNRIYAWAVKRLLGSAKHVVVLGPTLIADVKDHVSGEIHVVPNTPLDVPSIDAAPNSTVGVRVLFLSNLIPEKGIDDFISCAISLARSNSQVTFSIVGAASFAGQLEQIANRLVLEGLQHQIKVVGQVDHHQKWEILNETDLLVFPSVYEFEAQPLTIIEAGACSVATIAYQTGGIQDIVINGVNGLLVAPGNADALEESIQRLISNRDELDALRSGARRHFEEALSFDRFRSQWHDILAVKGKK